MKKEKLSRLERLQLANSKSIRNLLRQKWFIVILALMLTGLGAALTGVLFKAGIHKLEEWRINLLLNFPAWFILPLLGSLGGLISGSLISFVAPEAGGSGITQIISYIRHRKVPMGIKIGLVKLLAGVIAIGSGFPLGPEGPSVQMGGSVAWQMARWLKAPIAFRRVIVAAGGGAGIAAVFSAPIGGFIYAIEELLNSARPVVLLLVVITTFWADTWADVLQAIGLDTKAAGFDKNLGFQVEREYSASFHFLPVDLGYLIVLGIVIGVLAELYCRFLITMQKKGNSIFKKHLISRMVFAGFFLGVIYSCLPDAFHHLTGLQDLIVRGEGDIKLGLEIFIILFFTTGLASASGAPGGLFFPMLTLGGAIGLACGGWVESFTGHVPDTFIFAGMGGFISACSRTPITAMFLAFALTKNLLIMKPILITTITSFLIARIFNESSIYSRQIAIEKNLQPSGNN